MAAIASKVPHLLGGVTQVPHDQRHPSTFDVLENALVSQAHGLRKRPPTESVGLVATAQTGYDKAFVYAIDRKDDERYVVVIANGDLKVYDAITGDEQLVTFPDGKDYLNLVPLPARETNRGFRAFTVGDHTFIVNRDVEVRRGSKKADPAVHEALIFVRQGDYSTRYTVTIDGETVEVRTVAEGTPNARDKIATDVIAADIYDALANKSVNLKNAFSFSLLGSTVYVRKLDGSDFKIISSDGLADKGLRIIKGKVEAMEDLPAKAYNGMVVEVVGNPGSAKDNTWVQFEETGDTEGLWRECPKPGVQLDLDASTMPHELVREGKLTPVQGAAELHRQPSLVTELGTAYTTGWTTNQNDATINSDPAQNVEIDDSGEEVRSGAVNGSHASLPRWVEVTFDLDTTQMYWGALATVTLRANTGSGWSDLDSVSFNAGTVWQNQTFKRHMVVPPGTRFGLKLEVKNVWSKAPSSSRRVRLIAHGTAHAVPGIKISEPSSTKILTGTPGMKWPRGMRVDLTIEGIAFSTTLSDDKTTDQLNTDLAALVDSHVDLVASYTPSTGVQNDLLGFTVAKASGGAASVTAASFTFSNTTKFWNPNLNMTPGAYVGRVFKNITDGSQGTVVANSATAIEVDRLTGGSTNVFNVGDQCAVLGDGLALFVFRKAPWGERLVGDDELSPYPSFVDRRISDVGFYAGRLVFTAEDHIVMSAATDPYRFWRRTVTQVLDDDPIDVQSALPNVGQLDSLVLWNGQLLVNSSAGHQISVVGDGSLGPATIRLELLTSYAVADRVRPLVVGGSILFPRKAAGYTQVRELFRTPDGSFDSRSLTSHVQKFIPGDVIDCTGDGDIGFIAFLTDGDPNSVYVLNIISVGDEEHLAWHKWTFGNRVVGIHFVEGYLYLVLYRGTSVTLERINVAAPNYNAIHRDAGIAAYTFKARLNRHYLRGPDGPLTHGRTQVRTLELKHHGNGYYRVEVTPTGKDAKQYVVTSSEGKKRVPVLAQNDRVTIEIINDQTHGCGLSSIEWEATYGDRSRR